MRKIISGLALVWALGSASAAGSADFSQIEQTRLTELTECQLVYLAACYQATGDYQMCLQQAELYPCG